MNQKKGSKSSYVNLKFFLSIALVPMLLGGIIYILFRPESLVMFQWFDYLGFTQIIKNFRAFLLPLLLNTPDWVIYSIPDGIWVFSLTAMLSKIWQDGPIISKFIWCSIGPVIGIAGEIAQYFHLIKGTFDIDDLVVNIIFSALAFYLLKYNWGDLSDKN